MEHELPSLVMSNIFRYLDNEDVVNVGQTCQDWRYKAADYHVWSERHILIYVENGYLSPADSRIMAFAPGMKSVQLRVFYNDTPEVHPNLCSFFLASCLSKWKVRNLFAQSIGRWSDVVVIHAIRTWANTTTWLSVANPCVTEMIEALSHDFEVLRLSGVAPRDPENEALLSAVTSTRQVNELRLPTDPYTCNFILRRYQNSVKRLYIEDITLHLPEAEVNIGCIGQNVIALKKILSDAKLCRNLEEVIWLLPGTFVDLFRAIQQVIKKLKSELELQFTVKFELGYVTDNPNGIY